MTETGRTDSYPPATYEPRRDGTWVRRVGGVVEDELARWEGEGGYPGPELVRSPWSVWIGELRWAPLCVWELPGLIYMATTRCPLHGCIAGDCMGKTT